MILQRNGSSQGQTTHSGAEQHHPPRRLPPTHQHHWSIPQMWECSRRRPHSKEGVRTNNLTHVSINNQAACKKRGSNSAAIGALGVAVFRGQMQQVGCLVLLFNLGELFHQSPGVLRRHLTIVLPFDARQFSRRHQGKSWFFNLRNLVSMWPSPPSDVT